MKEKNKQSIIKATIKQIIVAFIYVIIICSFVYFLFGSTISKAISLIDLISVNTNKQILSDVKIDLETKNLKNYPEYGSKYGNIYIQSINVNLPLYFGDTLEILKNGVGHSGLSYFPGEGGTILCMGHNTANMLIKLPEVNLGDEIIIETTYGNYTYEVYDTKIVNYNEIDAAPIQRESEKLILYTCYPVASFGHATQRYLVYGNLVKEEIYESE